MSTATPPSRPASPMAQRPSPPPSAGGARATIDPFKLLKKYLLVLMIAGVVGVAVGIGGFQVLKRVAPQYAARTIFEVSPPRETVASGNEANVKKDELERFMNSQAQAILSPNVLERAVTDPVLLSQAADWCEPFLDRNGRLDTDAAMIELQETLVARARPGTVYVELSLQYPTSDDVYTVVKVVTDAYVRYLRETTRLDQQPIRDSLEQRLRSLRDDIERDQKAIDRLLIENGIESVDARLTEAGEELDLAVKDRAGVQEQVSLIQTQTEEYQRELNDPSGMQVPDDIRQRVRGNPLIQQLESQIQGTQARIRSLERLGIGTEHPSYKVLRADFEGLQEELAAKTATLQEQEFDAAISSLRVLLNQLRVRESELSDAIVRAQERLTEIARIAQEVASLQRAITQKQQRIDTTEVELDEVEGILAVAEQGRVDVFQPPIPPTSLASPQPIIVYPAGFLIVMSLTVGVILLRELLDQRVKGPADIALIPRTPVLGMLPDVSEDPSRPERAESAFHDRPSGVFAEAVRQLRVSIASKAQQAGHRSILVVPASPRSGSTTLVTNVAEAFSRADARVLILDANLRRPAVHKLFNLEPSPGLADVLARTTEIDDAVCKTDNPNLDVMTVGSSETRVFERLATEAMSETLARLESRYDLVLIDVAPAQVAGDAAGLANRVGGTILVTRALAEKRGLVARLKNELANARGEFLGVVVNGVRSSAGGYFKRNMKEAHAYQHKAPAGADA
ncbi:MAG: polysaccharide biosynthesis tyrosine autokinase [Planctomycetota bacterium]